VDVLKVLYFIVQQMMFYLIPLLVVALGAMFSERSGVVNIALEGIMIIGAFSGVLFLYFVQGTIPGQPVLLMAMVISAATGIVISLAHAYAAIHMKADQIISGTAINMFAPALAIYIARAVRTVQQIPFKNQFHIKSVPLLGDIPFIGDLFFKNTYITTFLGILILIVSWIVISKTRFGLRLKACGEHPQAADAAGISVYKMRYFGVMISGALAGIGGLVFIIPTAVESNASVDGFGFLALAVLIFGQWKPGRILFAAFFFGLMKAISAAYSGISFLVSIGISGYIYKMIPYIVTLLVLALMSKRSMAPRAEGIPYDKGSR